MIKINHFFGSAAGRKVAMFAVLFAVLFVASAVPALAQAAAGAGSTATPVTFGTAASETAVAVDYGLIGNTMQSRFAPALVAVAAIGAIILAMSGAVRFALGKLRGMFR